MKTAEELTREYFNANMDEVGETVFTEHCQYVKQIQLDAVKQGMTLASQEVKKQKVAPLDAFACKDQCEQAILTTRDNLTETDL